jgi:hypothetical protein
MRRSFRYSLAVVGVGLAVVFLNLASTVFSQSTGFFSSVGLLSAETENTGTKVATDDEGAALTSDYNPVGIRKGVWNDGQAALWDLNIIDHFHYFGPKERARGHRPEQPIKFSHVRHVQENKIECQFCHWNVAKSPYAAIPEVGTCVGCHNYKLGLIQGTTEEQKTEIGKIKTAHEQGKPIEWAKVHVMPDYVRFNHERHVKGGVACQECHGQIPEMEVVERVSSMKMGWCLDCHRAKGTSIDCYTCHY